MKSPINNPSKTTLQWRLSLSSFDLASLGSRGRDTSLHSVMTCVTLGFSSLPSFVPSQSYALLEGKKKRQSYVSADNFSPSRSLAQRETRPAAGHAMHARPPLTCARAWLRGLIFAISACSRPPRFFCFDTTIMWIERRIFTPHKTERGRGIRAEHAPKRIHIFPHCSNCRIPISPLWWSCETKIPSSSVNVTKS